MAKDQVPVLTLNPTEPPLRVASAPGPADGDRAIGRPQTDRSEEIQGVPAGDLGLDWAASIGRTVPLPASRWDALRASVRAGRARQRRRRRGRPAP